jgi:hypothetical protein
VDDELAVFLTVRLGISVSLDLDDPEGKLRF